MSALCSPKHHREMSEVPKITPICLKSRTSPRDVWGPEHHSKISEVHQQSTRQGVPYCQPNAVNSNGRPITSQGVQPRGLIQFKLQKQRLIHTMEKTPANNRRIVCYSYRRLVNKILWAIWWLKFQTKLAQCSYLKILELQCATNFISAHFLWLFPNW